MMAIQNSLGNGGTVGFRGGEFAHLSCHSSGCKGPVPDTTKSGGMLLAYTILIDLCNRGV